MNQILGQLSPRGLTMILGGILVIIVLGWHSYGFKGQLAEMNRLQKLRSKSEFALSTQQATVNEAQLLEVEKNVQALKERLHGERPKAEPAQMVSHIIGRLDRLSAKRSVALDSVKPGNQARVLSFTELPFDVEVRGDYFDLFAWLQDAEVELRPLVVKQFELRPVGTGGLLHMRLRVVSYRVPEVRP